MCINYHFTIIKLFIAYLNEYFYTIYLSFTIFLSIDKLAKGTTGRAQKATQSAQWPWLLHVSWHHQEPVGFHAKMVIHVSIYIWLDIHILIPFCVWTKKMEFRMQWPGNTWIWIYNCIKVKVVYQRRQPQKCKWCATGAHFRIAPWLVCWDLFD